MLLGFFRSAAGFLAQGPEPVAHTKKRESTNSEDDCDENDYDLHEIEEKERSCRGTILVTLRNVKPYTDW